MYHSGGVHVWEERADGKSPCSPLDSGAGYGSACVNPVTQEAETEGLLEIGSSRPAWATPTEISCFKIFFFFFAVLEFELRAYTLSHSTSLFLFCFCRV
jgi:hypothetical protein